MSKAKNIAQGLVSDNRFQILLLVGFFVGFILDVFFIIPSFDWGSDTRLFSLLLLWVFLCIISNFTSKATFKVAIGFLFVLYIFFLFFKTNPALERVASWLYFFLLIGVIQQFFESRKKSS